MMPLFFDRSDSFHQNRTNEILSKRATRFTVFTCYAMLKTLSISLDNEPTRYSPNEHKVSLVSNLDLICPLETEKGTIEKQNGLY